MAQDQVDSAKRKTLAVSQAAHMQSLAHGMLVWGTWPAAQMQSQASPFFYGWWRRRMGCPNAVSMKRLPKGSLAALAKVH